MVKRWAFKPRDLCSIRSNLQNGSKCSEIVSRLPCKAKIKGSIPFNLQEFVNYIVLFSSSNGLGQRTFHVRDADSNSAGGTYLKKIILLE